MFDGEEATSLFSLLGLLEPSEYLFTVDHSVLWQRHISWSKVDGEDLRQYVTQRYASNMVFLSCLLAAQINVFFNSSSELTEMRSYLETEKMGHLKYWIGLVILTDIIVTILALVNTYTVSRLVASLSDANSHALLRSSIGSYVAASPSRFTVLSIYLFLIWITMFIVDFVKGPIHYILLLMVLVLFFQVVIPLSAFGRLIIHTGAMGKRPVLDKELEKELLPSGLHASLLIRATDRKRKYSSATDQYRKLRQSSRHRQEGGGGAAATATVSMLSSNYWPGSQQFSSASLPPPFHPPRDIAFGDRPPMESDGDLTMDGENDHENDHDSDHESDHDHDSDGESISSPWLLDSVDEERPVVTGADPSTKRMGRHRRLETNDTVGSDNFFFPGAAILNATIRSKDIQNVVRQSITLSAAGADSVANSTHGSATRSMRSSSELHYSPSGGSGSGENNPGNSSRPQLITGLMLGARSSSPHQTSSTTTNNATGRKGGHLRQNSNSHSPRLAEHVHINTEVTESQPSPLNTTTSTTTIHNSPIMASGSGFGRRNRKFFASPEASHYQSQEQPHHHPLLRNNPSNTNVNGNGNGISPRGIRPPVHRPPRLGHHRRRSSSGRRSTGSFLGFVPMPSPQELDEENAIRASLELPLAPDLEYQEQLVEDQQMGHDYDGGNNGDENENGNGGGGGENAPKTMATATAVVMDKTYTPASRTISSVASDVQEQAFPEESTRLLADYDHQRGGNSEGKSYV